MGDIILRHNGNAAVDYLTEVILHRDDHPLPKYFAEDGTVEATGESPRFVVVRSRIETRNYCNDPKSAVELHRFVLMDGSETLFKAVTNSSLASELQSHHIHPGSTLIVLDYYLVKMVCSINSEARFVMLINKMSWQNPPEIKMAIEKSLVEFKISLSKSTIDAVERQSIVLFTVLNSTSNVESTNKTCSFLQLQHGDWIVEPSTRCDWKSYMSPAPTVEGKFA
jgi:hypothetical protein